MDALDDYARLTSSDLEIAYERLRALLDRYQVKATFAFVAAFSMSEDEVRSKISLFEEVGPRTRLWLTPFMTDLAAGRTDGWLVPNALSTIKQGGIHEIGSHGFSHLPLAENGIDAGEFSAELRSIFKTDSFAKETDLTLVYPRHLIGFTKELGRHGFVGYRDSHPKLSSRWQHLSDELYPFPKAQSHAPNTAEVVPIPEARFLNWRSGLRARIPISWTTTLWRKTIQDSVRSRKVTHLYSHPHNFATGRDMFTLLEEILKIAAPIIRAGELWNPTMKEYALAQRGQGALIRFS